MSSERTKIRTKPMEDWGDHDRMPYNLLSADTIIQWSQEQCYQRLQDFHNIARDKVFKKIPAGEKWTELALTRALLARLEGNSFSDISFALANPTNNHGNDVQTLFVEADIGHLASMLEHHCTPFAWNRARLAGLTYTSVQTKIRDFPTDRLNAILEKLHLQAGELFNAKRFGTQSGVLSPKDVLRAVELRILPPPKSHVEIINTLVTEGNRELGFMDQAKAAQLLSVSFSKYLSPKTKAGLKKYPVKRS